MKHISTKKAVYTLIGVGVVGFLVIFSLVRGRSAAPNYVTAVIGRADLTQTVSETGTVKASDELVLSFPRSGKLAKLERRVGDKVAAGDLIAELDTATLVLNRQEAAASLRSNEQSLGKLLSGATRAELAVTEANAEQAKASYSAAESDLEKIRLSVAENIRQAQAALLDLELAGSADLTPSEQAVITAETALANAKSTYQRALDNRIDSALITATDKAAVSNNALDTIERTLTDTEIEDTLSVKDPLALANTQRSQSEAKAIALTVGTKLAAARSAKTAESVAAAARETLALLQRTFSALSYCYTALEQTIVTGSFTQTELDTLKAGISADQTAVAAAIAVLQSAIQGLDDAALSFITNIAAAEEGLAQANAAKTAALKAAQNALATAKVNGDRELASAESRVATTRQTWQVAVAELGRVNAPANEHDVSLARARVDQARAVLAGIDQQITDAKLVAPIAGTITKLEYEIGEQVLSGAKMASLLGDERFQVEVLVSEADIAKIQRGDGVAITLDAYGDDIKLTGLVHFIEPAETTVQEVVYYRVDIIFDEVAQELKSGMTANVVVTTDERKNALVVPGRAVLAKNGSGKFVRVLKGTAYEEVPVTLGIRGDGGDVEVLTGLKENDVIVVSVTEAK